MLKISRNDTHPSICLDDLYSIIVVSIKAEVQNNYLVLWRAPLCEHCTFKVRIA